MVGLRRGEYRPDEIDDFVGRWQASDGEESMSSYLGMTYEEYAAWIEQRVTLHELMDKSHGFKSPRRVTWCNRFIMWLADKLLPGP
jgi:hypothetical protein